MREKLLRFSLVQLGIAAFGYIVNYFFFHYVTDTGISLVWQPEAGKPFVADLIGIFATMFLFGAAFSALAAIMLFDKKQDK